MKALTAPTLAHLAQETTTLSTCWKVTRKDGQNYGFTDADHALTIDGILYKATSGYTRSAVSSDSALSVSNLDVDGILSDDAITDADLLSGRWDFAEIRIFQVNRNDLTQQIKQRRGWFGIVTVKENSFVVELRGLAQMLQSPAGKLYLASCRADLGDTACGVNVAALTVAATITSLTNNRVFTATSLTQATGFFVGGLVTFTSGLNAGLSMEVRSFASGTITLQQPMPYEVVVSDTFTVYPGCDKSVAKCRDTYNNIINFRGEPYVPGIDALTKGPA